MNTSTMLVLIVVILGIAAAVWIYLKKERTKRLRSRFGPEYNRVVQAEGGSKQAEQVLEERQKRVERLDIKPLSSGERERFAQAWEHEQARFVDQPRAAVEHADRLVADAMRARGYPMGDFEQRAADVSVAHPVVVENYRVAHAIALRDRSEEVSTEELREAMIHYRALFADLLHDDGTRPVREEASESRARAKEAGR